MPVEHDDLPRDRGAGRPVAAAGPSRRARAPTRSASRATARRPWTRRRGRSSAPRRARRPSSRASRSSASRRLRAAASHSRITASGLSPRLSRPRSETPSRASSADRAAAGSRPESAARPRAPRASTSGPAARPMSCSIAVRGPSSAVRPSHRRATACAIDCSMTSTPLSGKERFGRNWSASATTSSSAASSIVTWRDRAGCRGRRAGRPSPWASIGVDRDLREPADEGRVGLEAGLVLLERRRADARDLAAGERRLQRLRRGRARPARRAGGSRRRTRPPTDGAPRRGSP